MDAPGRTVGQLTLHHVDVFSDRVMAGNGLAVVVCDRPVAAEVMLSIAQELRQFETIFLFEVGDDRAQARIFTPEEELAFADIRCWVLPPSCTPGRGPAQIAVGGPSGSAVDRSPSRRTSGWTASWRPRWTRGPRCCRRPCPATRHSGSRPLSGSVRSTFVRICPAR